MGFVDKATYKECKGKIFEVMFGNNIFWLGSKWFLLGHPRVGDCRL